MKLIDFAATNVRNCLQFQVYSSAKKTLLNYKTVNFVKTKKMFNYISSVSFKLLYISLYHIEYVKNINLMCFSLKRY